LGLFSLSVPRQVSHQDFHEKGLHPVRDNFGGVAVIAALAALFQWRGLFP
jgi:hypothetical protein